MCGLLKPLTLVLSCALSLWVARAVAAAGDTACSLEDVHVVSPADGATYYLQAGADAVSLMLIAEVNCIYDTYQVTFALDDVSVGTDAQAPYIVSGLDLSALAAGAHTVLATASSIYTAGLVVEDSVAFDIQEPGTELDTDENGIPDNPFTALGQDGDTWPSEVDVPETGETRRVGMVRWDGAEGHGSVAVSVAGFTAASGHITATVPGDLLDEGETGVLLVAAAPTRKTLLGPAEGPRLGCKAPGDQVSGSAWAEISVLVTTDDGVTFDEIEDTRLAAYPIHLSMEGLQPRTDRDQAFYRHPTFIDSDPVTGVYVAAESGAWSVVPNTSIASGRLTADLTSLSAFTVREHDGLLNPAAQAILLTLVLLVPTASALSEGEAGGGGPCFIATAAYGTPLAADIGVLRGVRDRWLLNNAAGAAAVDTYYRLSPPLANRLSRSPALAGATRLAIAPLVTCSRLLLASPGHLFAAVLIVAAVYAAAWRRRHRRYVS